MSNSLILLNLIRANRLAGLWNRSRVASTTNSKVMKSSRKSSIAWAIVSDLPLNWSSKTRALSIASTLVAIDQPLDPLETIQFETPSSACQAVMHEGSSVNYPAFDLAARAAVGLTSRASKHQP
ncbi:hypothetical protein NKH63_30010 [Mesorhizobium sp. M0960]|uniref:hypothetical protein n=1 Tax=Mesorhizobium sp. M0960 TaxID=2957035 RepID=UPI00333C3CFA